MNKKEKTKDKKKVWMVIGIVVAVLVVIYFGLAMFFSNRFVFGTTVNGVSCVGKTVEQVETTYENKVKDYVLTLEESGDITEEIKGSDIQIQYQSTGVIQKAMEEQNSFAWIVSLFKKNTIDAEMDITFDEAKLSEIVSGMECMKEENQVASVSAIPVYSEGTFVIQEETYGTTINQEQFTVAIHECIYAMKETLNLEEAQCYVLPTFTKDSPEVSAAQEAMNKCLETNITYSLDGIVVTLDASTIAGWLSVDENMNMVISSEGVQGFTATLSNAYNTAPRTGQITTPTGKVVTVAGATLGRTVGTDSEYEQLMSEIPAGTVVTREPVISQQATPEGQYAWGTTYAEVDLSTQHMWYISNGTVVFECDVVTGAPGLDTPAGVFNILEKKRNKTLVGNIDPATGKPEYETPVDYWVRVTWTGIGFHDATWQSAFGGQRYVQGYGSHGCINMPLSAAATFYDLISVGCPTVIHY